MMREQQNNSIVIKSLQSPFSVQPSKVAPSIQQRTHYIGKSFLLREPTLSMFRLLASKSQERKIFENHEMKPCLVGIHWIALTWYSQMSTHMPKFQTLVRFSVVYRVFASFSIGQLSHQKHS